MDIDLIEVPRREVFPEPNAIYYLRLHLDFFNFTLAEVKLFVGSVWFIQGSVFQEERNEFFYVLLRCSRVIRRSTRTLEQMRLMWKASFCPLITLRLLRCRVTFTFFVALEKAIMSTLSHKGKGQIYRIWIWDLAWNRFVPDDASWKEASFI